MNSAALVVLFALLAHSGQGALEPITELATVDCERLDIEQCCPSLALSSDTALIGARVFRRVQDEWRLDATLTPAPPYPEVQRSDTFGAAVALDGQRVIVGDCQAFASARLWSFRLR